MSRWIKKPEPFEAVLCDGPHVITFLRPGEFSEVSNDSLVLTFRSQLDGSVLSVRVPFDGSQYLVRDDEDGVTVINALDFEENYISFDTIPQGNFTAVSDDESSLSVSCDDCGPIGVADDDSGFADLATAHFREAHGGRW